MSIAPASSPKCALDYKHPEVEGQKYAVFFSADRRWLHPTPGLCELLGYSASELVGITGDKLFPPGVEWNQQLYLDFVSRGYLQTFVLLQSKSGEIVGLKTKSQKLKDGCMLAVFTPYP
jgi:hypothetical protein